MNYTNVLMYTYINMQQNPTHYKSQSTRGPTTGPTRAANSWAGRRTAAANLDGSLSILPWLPWCENFKAETQAAPSRARSNFAGNTTAVALAGI
jgi:hypothetical protein